MRSRALVILLLLASLSISQASFELLLVADGTSQCVRRFDGDTGIALGTFGATDLISPRAITVNQSLGHAYVSDLSQNKIFTYDFHTGEYIREFSGLGAVYSLSMTSTGDLLMASDSGVAQRLNATTGAVLTTYALPSLATGSASIVQSSSGNIHIAHQGNDRVTTYSLTGTILGSSAIAPVTLSSVGSGALRNNIGMAVDWNGRIIRYNATTNPTFLTSFELASAFNVPRGMAFGHGSRMYVVGSEVTTGNAIIRAMDADTGTIRGRIGSMPASSSAYYSIATVVAPEPGSLCALAGFVGVMLSRRKR